MILWADSGVVTASTPNPALGNGLALLGSLTVCGYLLIGRKLRAGMSLLAYIGLVYGGAAVCLMAAALAGGVALSGYSGVAWLCLAGMALGPQLLGHSAFNYALKHVTPTTIALSVLGEPVGSALLAWVLFGEGDRCGETRRYGAAARRNFSRSVKRIKAIGFELVLNLRQIGSSIEVQVGVIDFYRSTSGAPPIAKAHCRASSFFIFFSFATASSSFVNSLR